MLQTVPSPTPTPGTQPDPTCLALERLAATSGVCSTRDHCTELHCEVVGTGTLDLSFEPCSNPPAIDVVVADYSGNVLFNDTLTQSREESVGGNLVTVKITIKQSPNEDSISIKVIKHVFCGMVYIIYWSFSSDITLNFLFPVGGRQCLWVSSCHNNPRDYHTS